MNFIQILFSYKYILLWIVINACLAYKTKKNLIPYYRSNSNNNKTNSNIHDKYPEFKRHDKEPSFIKLFIAMCTYFWIKSIIWVSLLILIWVDCMITFRYETANDNSSIKKRNQIKRIMRWYCWLGFKALLIFFKERKSDDIQTYSKWLGSEFILNYDTPTAIILCNHIGWYEVQYLMYRFAPGFVAKESLRKAPFVSSIADYLNTLWLNRTCMNSKNEVISQINKRQEKFEKGEVLSPIIIFPEGTTSSGKHILKFKKGAFEGLKPLKSILVKVETSDTVEMAEGITPILWNAVNIVCSLYHVVEVIELPVIYPTEFMYDNYQNLYPNHQKSKSEIFADVIKKIWCEVGGFENSDKEYRDFLEYLSAVIGKDVHST